MEKLQSFFSLSTFSSTLIKILRKRLHRYFDDAISYFLFTDDFTPFFSALCTFFIPQNTLLLFLSFLLPYDSYRINVQSPIQTHTYTYAATLYTAWRSLIDFVNTTHFLTVDYTYHLTHAYTYTHTLTSTYQTLCLC